MMWIAVVLGGLAAAVATVLGVGARLPREHVVTRRIRLAAPIEAVWERIANRAGEPAWRRKVSRVVREPDRDGRPAWREEGGEGVTLVEVSVEPPRRLVRRIVDNKMFGGEWEIVLEPADGATTVRITERGEVYHPLARFFSRYAMGLTRTVDGYLRELAASFGETPATEDGG